MRKVILNVAVTLDGFIEGPNGEYDWCFTDQDYGMEKFLNDTDAIFFGRVSYEQFARSESPMWNDKKKYVFSTTLKDIDEETILINEGVERKVKEIKAEQGKDIWLFGGASLTTTFVNAGLVDELMIAVHPVILGKGKPLFKDITKEKINLKLTGSKTYSSGLVHLWYDFPKDT